MSRADVMGRGPFLKELAERLDRMTKEEARTTGTALLADDWRGNHAQNGVHGRLTSSPP